ncbi:unnamed protein product [Blepharisma stoltei]|uniref:Uncharacterized protein n=1 Tax=Blepharisma stoltei TaxID=1481888 RepID=A0AAU9KI99_9CILI|nr:unnamed protein product [Blepharisma stoltei]
MYKTFDNTEALDFKKDLKFKELAIYAKKPGTSRWFHNYSGVPISTLMNSYKPTLPNTPYIKTHRTNHSCDVVSPTNNNTTHNFTQIAENKLKDLIGKNHYEDTGHCYKLTPKSSKLKVEDALNYLKLREIGCSKQEAITFCSRDRCTHSVAEFELPARLRRNHSSAAIVSQENTKYKIFKSKMESEGFDTVNQAITNYLITHRYEPEPYMNSFLEEKYQKNSSEIVKKEYVETEPPVLETEENINEENKYDYKSSFKTLLERIINTKLVDDENSSSRTPSNLQSPTDFTHKGPFIRFSSIISPKYEPRKFRPESLSLQTNPQTSPASPILKSVDTTSPTKNDPITSKELKLKQSRKDFLIMRALEEKIKKNIINAKYELYEKLSRKATQNAVLFKKKQLKKQKMDEEQKKELENNYEEIKEKLEKAKQERIKIKEEKKLKTKEYNKKHDKRVEELKINKNIDLERRTSIMIQRVQTRR